DGFARRHRAGAAGGGRRSAGGAPGVSRIVAGRWGGRTLTTPSGAGTRPTSEKVRAALANSLAASGGLVGARVLDLFAGSGAIGLELLSRGAADVVLVENDRRALAACRANIDALGARDAELVAAAAVQYVTTVAPDRAGFDIVVADPPYDLSSSAL